MCTREMGADQVFVWPEVELAVMGAQAAVTFLYKHEIEKSSDPEATRREKIAEYTDRFSGPFEAAQKQFAQAVIKPEETRMRLIQALDLLRSKKEERPRKKHGLMPV